MDRVVRQTSEFVGTEVVEQERISCHHNYTESEEHFGEQVWVSRKGAIDASTGRAGLIPGSMGTASYVVAGKHAGHHVGRGVDPQTGRPSDASMAPLRVSHTSESKCRSRAV